MRLPEENPRGDITILPGLIPSLADDAALGTAEQSGALIITGDGGNGGGHSGGSSARLKKKCNVIFVNFKKLSCI